MKLPIYLYGQSVLRKEAELVAFDQERLPELIQDLFETMYASKGVGLAAPQVGKSLSLFVIDAKPFSSLEGLELEEKQQHFLSDFKSAFINPEILSEDGEPWTFEEGCLSIPDFHVKVSRKPNIEVVYYDQDFNRKEACYTGLAARIFQHEYDHLKGRLFIDYLSPLSRSLAKKKLDNISKGKVEVPYSVVF